MKSTPVTRRDELESLMSNRMGLDSEGDVVVVCFPKAVYVALSKKAGERGLTVAQLLAKAISTILGTEVPK